MKYEKSGETSFLNERASRGETAGASLISVFLRNHFTLDLLVFFFMINLVRRKERRTHPHAASMKAPQLSPSLFATLPRAQHTDTHTDKNPRQSERKQTGTSHCGLRLSRFLSFFSLFFHPTFHSATTRLCWAFKPGTRSRCGCTARSGTAWGTRAGSAGATLAATRCPPRCPRRSCSGSG